MARLTLAACQMARLTLAACQMARLTLAACQMARLTLAACQRHVLSLLHAEWHVLCWMNTGGISEVVQAWGPPGALGLGARGVSRQLGQGQRGRSGPRRAAPILEKDEPASEDRIALRLVASREDEGIPQLAGKAERRDLVQCQSPR
jgi:hypothetical protein